MKEEITGKMSFKPRDYIPTKVLQCKKKKVFKTGSFYWVKWKNGGLWDVALYQGGDEEFWAICGTSTLYETRFFDEIGEEVNRHE
jgi:hypothetical protein